MSDSLRKKIRQMYRDQGLPKTILGIVWAIPMILVYRCWKMEVQND